METKTESTHEVRLYIGSVEGYHGRSFGEDELVTEIGNFQAKHEFTTPVRVTPTRFVNKDYNERGWEVAAICYPRAPLSRTKIDFFMADLAKHLLTHFKQNRISVVYPETTVMYQAENAEQHH